MTQSTSINNWDNKPKMKLKDFAGIVKGVIQGDPETEITGVSGIMDAKAGDITFLPQQNTWGTLVKARLHALS